MMKNPLFYQLLQYFRPGEGIFYYANSNHIRNVVLPELQTSGFKYSEKNFVLNLMQAKLAMEKLLLLIYCMNL